MLTKLWVFPVGVALLIPGTFFLTYSIAVTYDHVQPFIPYISDTGSYPPESCIFAQLLNISGLLVGVVIYLRHRQIVEFYRHAAQSKQRFINCSTIFLWIGYSSAFGMSMVGNFQQTAWLFTHVIGAFLAFGFGLVYCWGQTVFTYRMALVLHRRWTSHVRLGLAIIATGCFISMSFLGFNPIQDPTPQRAVYRNECVLWLLVFIRPGEQGYVEHTITTACEWTMAIVFVLYFATYAVELRHAVLIPPKLVLMIEHSKLPKDAGYICTSYMDGVGACNIEGRKKKIEQDDAPPFKTNSSKSLRAMEKGGNLHFPVKKIQLTSLEISGKMEKDEGKGGGLSGSSSTHSKNVSANEAKVSVRLKEIKITKSSM